MSHFTFGVEKLERTAATPLRLAKPRFCQLPSPETVNYLEPAFSHASPTALFIDWC